MKKIIGSFLAVLFVVVWLSGPVCSDLTGGGILSGAVAVAAGEDPGMSADEAVDPGAPTVRFEPEIIPSLAQYGLALLAALVAVSGGFAIIRRRRSS